MALLSVSSDNTTTTRNLTTLGPTDWEHYQASTARTRKTGTPGLLSDWSAVGSITIFGFNGAPRAMTASNPSVNDADGILVTDTGNGGFLTGDGLQWTCPADDGPTKTLTFLGGCYFADAVFTASMTGGGVSTQTINVSNGGDLMVNVTITFQAASPGQTLTISWVMGATNTFTYSNVSASALALDAPAAASYLPPLSRLMPDVGQVASSVRRMGVAAILATAPPLDAPPISRRPSPPDWSGPPQVIRAGPSVAAQSTSGTLMPSSVRVMPGWSDQAATRSPVGLAAILATQGLDAPKGADRRRTTTDDGWTAVPRALPTAGLLSIIGGQVQLVPHPPAVPLPDLWPGPIARHDLASIMATQGQDAPPASRLGSPTADPGWPVQARTGSAGILATQAGQAPPVARSVYVPPVDVWPLVPPGPDIAGVLATQGLDSLPTPPRGLPTWAEPPQVAQTRVIIAPVIPIVVAAPPLLTARPLIVVPGDQIIRLRSTVAAVLATAPALDAPPLSAMRWMSWPDPAPPPGPRSGVAALPAAPAPAAPPLLIRASPLWPELAAYPSQHVAIASLVGVSPDAPPITLRLFGPQWPGAQSLPSRASTTASLIVGPDAPLAPLRLALPSWSADLPPQLRPWLASLATPSPPLPAPLGHLPPMVWLEVAPRTPGVPPVAAVIPVAADLPLVRPLGPSWTDVQVWPILVVPVASVLATPPPPPDQPPLRNPSSFAFWIGTAPIHFRLTRRDIAAIARAANAIATASLRSSPTHVRSIGRGATSVKPGGSQ